MDSRSDYKSSKEAFVSGMTGSSVTHVNLLSLAALSSIALYSALRSRVPPNRSFPFALLTEFGLLIVPLILSTTLFALSPFLLSSLLAVSTILVLIFVPRAESGTPLPSNANASPRPSPTIPPRELRSSLDGVGVAEEDSNPSTPVKSHVRFSDDIQTRIIPEEDDGRNSADRGVVITPLPALSTYRAHMMLMTIICILAVDFPVFPRELAKCETFGVSLMDIGVGSFVFSQGIVSAAPLLKDPAYLSLPLVPKLIRTTRKCAPIILLGLIRVILVKGTEYPEHVTEYGVHWNFFLTLAVIPVFQIFLHPLIAFMPISLLGIIVAVVDQVLLAFGLASYVLDAPRQSLISANKEGIVSLTGYLAIHLLGLSTGTYLLPPSPSLFRRRQQAFDKSRARRSKLVTTNTPHPVSHSPSQIQSLGEEKNDYLTVGAEAASYQPRDNGDSEEKEAHRENDRTATELASYAFIWWSLLGVCSLMSVGGGVSRRMANLPYVLWVAAYNTSFILGYLLLDLYFFPSPTNKSIYSPTSKLKQHGPPRHTTRLPSQYNEQPVTTSYQPPSISLARTGTPSPTPAPRARYTRQDSEGKLSVDEWRSSVLSSPGPTGGLSVDGRGITSSGGLSIMGSQKWGQVVQVGAPTLLEAINKNGLAMFLLANLATGLVNMSMKTMYASNTTAMCVLVAYCWVICTAAWVFRERRLWML